MGETTGGVLRRGSDRIVGGVCSGLAAYFGVDVLLVRIIFVILAFTPPGIGVILYLVLWFLMEPPQGAPTWANRNIGDRIRAMGQEIREDFRSGFSRSQQAGDPGSPPPPPPPSGGPAPPSAGPPYGWSGPGHRGRPRGLWVGILLVVLGAYILVANIGLLNGFRWDIFGPIVLIAIGLLVLVRRR